MEILRLENAKSPGNETWRDALVRFERLCHTNVLEYDDGDRKLCVNFAEAYDEKLVFEVRSPRSEEELKKYELKYQVSIPTSLKALLCTHGPFFIYWLNTSFGRRWGEREFLGFYSSNDTVLFPNIKPLTIALDFNYGHYFADACLTNEQIARLDERYFAFGYASDDDHSHTYLLFDKARSFGTYYFHTEDYPESQSAILRLLETGFTQTNFDSFVVDQIDKAIDCLLRYNEVYD
jgi:hypothetical protein